MKKRQIIEGVMRRFDDKFGIHFKNNKDELRFVHIFLEEEIRRVCREAEEEVLEKIIDSQLGNYEK